MSESIGIEEARKRLGDLVTAAKEHHEPTIITRTGKPAAVLISMDDFNQSFQRMSEAARRLGEAIERMGGPARRLNEQFAPVAAHLKATTLDTQVIADQVTTALGDEADGFDVAAIVEEIGDTYGRDAVGSVDDVPSEEFWEIVRKHER